MPKFVDDGLGLLLRTFFSSSLQGHGSWVLVLGIRDPGYFFVLRRSHDELYLGIEVFLGRNPSLSGYAFFDEGYEASRSVKSLSYNIKIPCRVALSANGWRNVRCRWKAAFYIAMTSARNPTHFWRGEEPLERYPPPNQRGAD